ncbi:Piwi-domain-containing protein [Guyanagaster necrorhizus]|uniref:Piwi-domain-containing protein n=1 Tax=Guyanagaster necrorhizus TaxID=856835 RepID=A0A9P7W579_9AGAR|nr:Piwi-domain-containing protein [Guyanagaster necrorhizus MCA 3950]KAG7452837.1 Piwi-domain-containing protein [Guyanagaster necrorhizus MCA 3950]
MARPSPQEFTVVTNCFTIDRLPQKEYLQYDGTFHNISTSLQQSYDLSSISPQVDRFKTRQAILRKLQNDIAPSIFCPKAIYDGDAILYASKDLELPSGGKSSFLVSLSNQHQSTVTEGTRGVYAITLTKTIGQTIKPSDLRALMIDRKTSPKTATATNLLQLLIVQETNQKNPHNNRAFFSDTNKRVVGDGLEFWRGFFQSVRPSTSQMLINIDITMTAMYQSGNVIDVSLSHLGSRQVRDLTFSTKDAKFRSLSIFLKGLEIRCRTTGSRTRFVRELVARGGRYEFEKDGHMTTVGEYFRSAHSTSIQFPDAFGILTSGKNASHPVVYPAELCTIVPGQLYKKRLPNHLTREAVSFATMAPDVRLKAIMGDGDSGRGIVSPIQGYRDSKYIQESGMQISRSPLFIKGIMLPTPRITMGRADIRPNNGAWNLRDQKFSFGTKLGLWGVLNFIPSLNERLCRTYVDALHQQCSSLGMTMSAPVAIKSGSENNVFREMNDLVEIIYQKIGRKDNIQMILVMLPARGDPVHTQVKQWGDVQTGVPTQCLRSEKIINANVQYWANVALKINARLGGYNHRVGSAAFDEISKKPFMIMGADVSHASPQTFRPSVASLVWSRDQHASQYIASTRIQHPRTEGIVELKDMVKSAVLQFSSRNSVPERIFFFRDGISDEEVDSVGAKEVGDIEEALKELWLEKKSRLPLPKVTFLVVGKRHHVVFFPKDGGLRDRTGNCKAGFVTTGGLESPLFKDFYLQSHAAIKGTSRSSHYIVLKDENFGKNLEKLHDLSYMLCHVYSKATRSVSIPAPVYYAHLVCTRAAYHFPGEMHFLNDDTESMASTDTGRTKRKEFDLEPWQREWKPLNGNMAWSMYFL